MSRFRLLAVVAAMVAASSAGRATDYTWTQVAGGDWSVAGNWSPAGPPNLITDNATLGTLSGSYAVTLTDTRSINNLTIGDAGATLNQTGGSLTVGGTFAVNAGTYTLSGGTLTLNGTMTTGVGAAANWTGGTLTGSGTLTGQGNRILFP